MKKTKLTILALALVFTAGVLAPSAMATPSKHARKHHKKGASTTEAPKKS